MHSQGQEARKMLQQEKQALQEADESLSLKMFKTHESKFWSSPMQLHSLPYFTEEIG